MPIAELFFLCRAYEVGGVTIVTSLTDTDFCMFGMCKLYYYYLLILLVLRFSSLDLTLTFELSSRRITLYSQSVQMTDTRASLSVTNV